MKPQLTIDALKKKVLKMKPQLTIDTLKKSAIQFCEQFSKENHIDLRGLNDGKTIGTHVEQKFQQYLCERYSVRIGNSASGIDLPDDNILTDIKVTSITQPQSSCPFKNARQKIFGLGYNLLVFVYKKKDTSTSCSLQFKYCIFIDKERTGDFTITRRLREMVNDGANKEDIIAFLQDKQVPGDEIIYSDLADKILTSLPKQGYLTISNAFQWRLKYSNAIKLNTSVEGVTKYVW